MAARIPRSRGMASGTVPSTSSRPPPRETSVAEGLRPTNDQRLHRSSSTDSRRKPAPSPTTRRNADTGVVRSATNSCHTGTTVWPRASAWKSSLLGRSTERPEEARALSGVAGAATLLLHDEEEHIAIAVVVRLADVLAIARGLSLAPVLLAGTAPEPRAAGLEGLAQGLGVHPGHHQHAAGARLLHDGGHEAVAVERDVRQVAVIHVDGRRDGHETQSYGDGAPCHDRIPPGP